MGYQFTKRRGDLWEIPFTSLGDLSDATVLYFTVKPTPPNNITDADSIVQIVLTIPGDADDGLIVLNGDEPKLAAYGAISIDDEDDGDITITILGIATAEIEPGSRAFDIQKTSVGDGVVTIADGRLVIMADITRVT